MFEVACINGVGTPLARRNGLGESSATKATGHAVCVCSKGAHHALPHRRQLSIDSWDQLPTAIKRGVEGTAVETPYASQRHLADTDLRGHANGACNQVPPVAVSTTARKSLILSHWCSRQARRRLVVTCQSWRPCTDEHRPVS